jgi:hypothetical protein
MLQTYVTHVEVMVNRGQNKGEKCGLFFTSYRPATVWLACLSSYADNGFHLNNLQTYYQYVHRHTQVHKNDYSSDLWKIFDPMEDKIGSFMILHNWYSSLSSVERVICKGLIEIERWRKGIHAFWNVIYKTKKQMGNTTKAVEKGCGRNWLSIVSICETWCQQCNWVILTKGSVCPFNVSWV